MLRNILLAINTYYGVQEGNLLQTITIDAGLYAQYLTDLLKVQTALLSSLSLDVGFLADGSLISVWFENDREVTFRRVNTWTPREESSQTSQHLCDLDILAGEGKSLLRLCLAAALARVIRERVAVDYMAALVDKIGPIFSSEERASILDDAVKQAYAGEIRAEYVLCSDWPGEPDLCACLSCTEMRGIASTTITVDYVFLRVFEYLSSNDQLYIEGFVRFRLKDYLSRLQLAVYRAVDGFLLDQQHAEFVDLLRYFVEAQKPRIESVTIVRRQDGYLEFYDGAGRLIEYKELLRGIDDIVGSDLGFEDILIGLLIAMAPQRVMICMRGGRLLFDTTVRVFRGRILVCDGCSNCRLYADNLSDRRY